MAQTKCKQEPLNRLAGDNGFKGKTLLLTGGTGFMGKVLTEKILRTTPLVKKIYIIARSKKEKNPEERLKEIFAGPLFDLLKQTQGEEILKKVVAIDGDISQLGLGLSQENRRMLTKEVEIIYHMAATIRFDDPLSRAVLLNTRGTKMMLDLAKECKNLMVFVYVSTAYCHLNERILFEKTYPPPTDPHDIIRMVETIGEGINLNTKEIMGNIPNAYVFSKALAEGLVAEQLDTLPIIIVRPSVVVPIWRDPLPGWTDNINGPAGLLLAAGKGVLRTMYCNPKGYADYLPVDIAANVMLVTTYDYLTQKTRQIYNLTSSSEYKITWADVINLGRHTINTKMPFNWVVWYPGGSMKSSRWVHNICVVLFHYIPAVLLDSLIILSGHKPVLWRVQQRITKGFEMLEFFANNQWDFNNENTLLAIAGMKETEKEIYKTDGEGLVLENYFYDCVHALRLYILHESDASIPTARRHMKIMWAVDKLCKMLILLGFGKLLLQYGYPIIGFKV